MRAGFFVRLPSVAWAILVLFACAARPASGADKPDVWCAASEGVRGGVILLHAGAFSIDVAPWQLREMCEPWVREGFDAVAVRYPLRDYAGAVRASRRAARAMRGHVRPRPVIAFGESAGGTLAALLAVRGEVGAAAVVAAPTNLVAWRRGDREYWHGVMGMSLAQRRRGSPIFGIRRRPPVLLLHSPDDVVVPIAQSVSFAARLPCARLARLSGPHLEDASATPRAVRWTRRVARRSAPRGRPHCRR
jgi:acetyl esterase/lipase